MMFVVVKQNEVDWNVLSDQRHHWGNQFFDLKTSIFDLKLTNFDFILTYQFSAFSIEIRNAKHINTQY